MRCRDAWCRCWRCKSIIETGKTPEQILVDDIVRNLTVASVLAAYVWAWYQAWHH